MALRLPRLQFLLRTLGILLVIVVALASWHGSRYERYKARLAARLQAQEHGLVFYTREEAESFQRYTFQADAEPTLAERWDLFWFGPAAGKFPACEMSLKTYTEHPKGFIEKNYHRVLELHPEIEWAMCSAYGDRKGRFGLQEFDRVAWVIMDQDQKLRAQAMMLPVTAFARIPNLRFFQFADPAQLDDLWVDALPEDCALREIVGFIKLSPAGVQQLFHKAPNLLKIQLTCADFSEEVQNQLSERYTIQKIFQNKYLIEAKN